jgi:hypothetical protein
MLSWAAGGDWPRPTTTIAVAPTFPRAANDLPLSHPSSRGRSPHLTGSAASPRSPSPSRNVTERLSRRHASSRLVRYFQGLRSTDGCGIRYLGVLGGYLCLQCGGLLHRGGEVSSAAARAVATLHRRGRAAASARRALFLPGRAVRARASHTVAADPADALARGAFAIEHGRQAEALPAAVWPGHQMPRPGICPSRRRVQKVNRADQGAAPGAGGRARSRTDRCGAGPGPGWPAG